MDGNFGLKRNPDLHDGKTIDQPISTQIASSNEIFQLAVGPVSAYWFSGDASGFHVDPSATKDWIISTPG